MIDTEKEKPETKYLLLKRGLYYRPDSSGYTGIKEEAGRYTREQTMQHHIPEDGVNYIHESDAPEYSSNCIPEEIHKHLNGKLKAALARIAELEARLDVYVQREVRRQELEDAVRSLQKLDKQIAGADQ